MRVLVEDTSRINKWGRDYAATVRLGILMSAGKLQKYAPVCKICRPHAQALIDHDTDFTFWPGFPLSGVRVKRDSNGRGRLSVRREHGPITRD